MNLEVVLYRPDHDTLNVAQLLADQYPRNTRLSALRGTRRKISIWQRKSNDS